MAITNLYPNLPGHLVEFKDGGMQLVSQDEQTTGTKSLLILGTAMDGPVMEPVRIDSETVSQLFGSDVDADGYPNGATITKYAKQAFRNGFGDVRCMRVTGSPATVEIEKGTSAVVSTSGQKELKPSLRIYYADQTALFDKLVTNATAQTGFVKNGNNLAADTGYVIKKAACQNVSFDQANQGEIATVSSKLLPGATISVQVQKKDTASTPSPLGQMDESNATHTDASTGQLVFNEFLTFTVDKPVLASGTIFNADNLGLKLMLKDSAQVSVYPTTTITYEDANGNTTGVTFDDAVHIIFEASMSSVNASLTTPGALEYQMEYNTLTDSSVVSITVDASDIIDDKNNQIFGQNGTSDYVVPICGLDDTDGTGISSTSEGVYNIGPVSIWTPDDQTVTPYEITAQGVPLTVNIQAATGGNFAYGANLVLSPTNIAQYNDLANSRFGEAKVASNGVNYVELKFTYKTNVKTVTTEKIIVSSIYGGSVYNGDGLVAYNAPVNGNAVVVSKLFADDGITDIGRRFTFYKSDAKKYSTADKPFYFDSTVCPTVGRIREALSKYQYNNVFEILPDNDDLATNDFPEGVYFLGGTIVYPDGTSATNCGTVGTDGINPTNNELFEALAGKRNATTHELIEQGAYQLLENYHVDFIYPAGVYADAAQTVDPYSSFHNELAMCCAALTYRTKMTHGFIDVKPNTNTTLKGVQKYVDDLMNYDTVLYIKDREGNELVDSNGEKMEIGWYTSLVVGPEPIMSSDTLGTYYGSPAIAYAALCGLLAPQSAPTNKALSGVSGLKFKFSNKQMDMLTGKHMITFKLKGEGTATASSTPYVVDGCTCGSENCDYRRMSTVKIVTDVVDQIRQVCDPFIGEPNVREQKNAMSALVSKLLSNDMTAGEITSYSFSIEETLDELISGRTRIMLELTVPMELRLITTVVALRAGI